MASSKHFTVARDYWDAAGIVSADQESLKPQSASETCDDPGEFLDSLVRTIEGEIIPRLVVTHASLVDGTPVPAAENRTPSGDEVEEFTDLVLSQDIGAATSYIEALRAQGVSLESVFLHLLAPAARRLGDFWTADIADFAKVTVGLGRLQQLLREFAQTFRTDVQVWQSDRRALVTAVPGEQHTLGVLMVAEFLRRAGWDVLGWPSTTRSELVDTVGKEQFTLVGLSLGSEAKLGELTSVIGAVRKASRNSSVSIMVGGPVFIEHPECVALVGADATAVDGRQAAIQAENLLAPSTERC